MLAKNLSKNDVKHAIQNCYDVYKKFEWLLDSYVLDFYTENHWDQLPNAWKVLFECLQLEDIANIINVNLPLKRSVALPLSLLALRQFIKQFSLERHPTCSLTEDDICEKHNDFELNVSNFFWKNVKAKKRHEIELIAKTCYELAEKTGVSHLIDVGSGVGHLSKILTYKYGLQVYCIEAQENLSSKAKKLDNQLEKMLYKRWTITNDNEIKSPIHITLTIDTSSDGQDVIEILKDLIAEDVNFGVVGLHTCGNLGTTLIRLFRSCARAKFLSIVGCCYMKLSTAAEDSEHFGYPISRFCIQKNYSLTYNSREVACHAIENYTTRLKQGRHWQLKIHAYRAALEKLIVHKWPHLRHSSVNNVKYTPDLTFSDYCRRALCKLNVMVSDTELDLCTNDLQQWMRVVIHYSIKLMLAPLVETIVSLDRILYIIDSGFESTIVPLFDPEISPRNQVLIAIK